MCMEFCNGGELFTLLTNMERWPESYARFYAAEIILALGYMHANGVMHRDLKSENLLMDRHGHLKLTDFGVSKGNIKDLKTGRTRTLMKGTIEYIAPEMITEDEYGFSVDFYSLGLVIYEMLSAGEHPFKLSERKTQEDKIDDKLHGRIEMKPYFSKNAVNLLEGLT